MILSADALGFYLTDGTFEVAEELEQPGCLQGTARRDGTYAGSVVCNIIIGSYDEVQPEIIYEVDDERMDTAGGLSWCACADPLRFGRKRRTV